MLSLLCRPRRYGGIAVERFVVKSFAFNRDGAPARRSTRRSYFCGPYIFSGRMRTAVALLFVALLFVHSVWGAENKRLW